MLMRTRREHLLLRDKHCRVLRKIDPASFTLSSLALRCHAGRTFEKQGHVAAAAELRSAGIHGLALGTLHARILHRGVCGSRFRQSRVSRAHPVRSDRCVRHFHSVVRYGIALVLVFPISFVMGTLPPARASALAFAGFVLSWVVIPGVALLLGDVPFLRRDDAIHRLSKSGRAMRVS